MNTSRRHLLVAGSLAALSFAAACQGGSDPAVDGVPGSGFSVQGSLEQVPAATQSDEVLIQAGDLDRAAQLAGLEQPEPSDDEAVGTWLSTLTGGPDADPDTPVFVPLAEHFNVAAASPAEFADVIGWSVLDVETFVEESSPPQTFAVVTGDFDGDTLDGDLMDLGDGIRTDREGEDLETDLEHIGPLSQVGNPIRVARQGDSIAVSTSTPAVRAWLDGEGRLADVDPMAGVAAVLDEQDVYSAVLARPRAADADEPVSEEAMEGSVTDEPFDAVGIGWDAEDGQALVHVAYHFDSREAAEESVDPLEDAYREGTEARTGTPYSEQMQVEAVSTSGSVVTVSVTPTEPAWIIGPYQLLQAADPLFLSP